MFGNDKKGNYGPLSLHDYSDDSDDENDFVSEQIRNQRVSGWAGLFREACWPLAKSEKRWHRPRCIDFELWQSTEERRSKIKSYVDFRICPDSPDCCGEILISVRRHGLPTIISDVVVEVLYPCVASQKRRF